MNVYVTTLTAPRLRFSVHIEFDTNFLQNQLIYTLNTLSVSSSFIESPLDTFCLSHWVFRFGLVLESFGGNIQCQSNPFREYKSDKTFYNKAFVELTLFCYELCSTYQENTVMMCGK